MLGPDGAEAVARQLDGQAGELGAQPVDDAVGLEGEPAVLLDPLQVLLGRVPSFDPEVGTVLGCRQHLAGGQLAPALVRVGVALPDRCA